MPYAILTGSLPPSKMGYYMGVFNFFIVIPQIVAAALLGFLVGRFFGGEAIYALAIGGASLLLAAALTLRVEDRDEPEAGTWHPGFPPRSDRPRPPCWPAAAGARRPPRAPADPRRLAASVEPVGLLEQRHDLLSPHRPLPEWRSQPTTGRWAVRRTERCCAASRVATSPACWKDRGGLLRQPGRDRHLDDALRGADPRQRGRGNRKDIRLPRLLDPRLDRGGSRARNPGGPARGGGRGPPARHPGSHGRGHQPQRAGDPQDPPWPDDWVRTAPTAPTGTTPPRWTAPWWRPSPTSAPSGTSPSSYRLR